MKYPGKSIKYLVGCEPSEGFREDVYIGVSDYTNRLIWSLIWGRVHQPVHDSILYEVVHPIRNATVIRN